jgi:hypothetical protein
MQIKRQVVINPIEPVELSMRVPASLAATLMLSFVNNLFAPITTDLKATLSLTGRSTGQTKDYKAVSTDMTNGKASVTLPAGELTDANGYRVRLFGEQPPGNKQLLALGVMRAVNGTLPDDF